jgi:hypothetical protein
MTEAEEAVSVVEARDVRTYNVGNETDLKGCCDVSVFAYAIPVARSNN